MIAFFFTQLNSPFFPLRLMSGLIKCVSSSVSSSSSSSVQFYELRLMFLITALRPELRVHLRQVTSKNKLLHNARRAGNAASDFTCVFSHLMSPPLPPCLWHLPRRQVCLF